MKLPDTGDFITLRTGWSGGFAQYTGTCGYEENDQMLTIFGTYRDQYARYDEDEGLYKFEVLDIMRDKKHVTFTNHTLLMPVIIDDMISL